MEDIELVIKISKAYYELVLERCKEPVLLNAFKNGVALPKGHGRLIDADELKKVYDERITYLYALNKKDNPSPETRICTTNWCTNTIDELPTIIKADKAESEVK